MFSYLQRSIPSLARENELTIYYRPENSEIWQALDTTINIERNLASALMIDRGDYALIAVETYPVLQANMWNPFGYTIYNSRTIAEALASIDGSYRTVLWYDTSDQTWDIYDTTIEPPLASLVNTLQQFEYGQGYWIYATETITPYLGISTADSARAVTSHYPPMIVYGWVNSGTQTLDQQTTITALIDNQICGQAQIEEIGNRQAYTIQIDASNTKECNTIHATISLAINGVHVHQIDIWDNSQLHHIPLHEPNDTTTMHQQIFLPHLQK